jgi:hypothetical protein
MCSGSGTTAKLLQIAKPGGKLFEAAFERRKLAQQFRHNKTCECEFKFKRGQNKPANKFIKKDVITRTRQGPRVADGLGTMPAFAKGTLASAGSIPDTS